MRLSICLPICLSVCPSLSVCRSLSLLSLNIQFLPPEQRCVCVSLSLFLSCVSVCLSLSTTTSVCVCLFVSVQTHVTYTSLCSTSETDEKVPVVLCLNITSLQIEQSVQFNFICRGGNDKKAPANRPLLKKINFPELLQHFQTVQEKHRAARRQPKSLEEELHNT